MSYRPSLLLVNVHLLYALIHDYDKLIELFLHPALQSLFPGDPFEGNNNGDEETAMSSAIRYALPHGMVLMAKHYLDVLDVLSVDSFLFSASQVC